MDVAERKTKGAEEFPDQQAELALIRSKGFDPADVVALAGYVGVAPSDEVLRLHPGLDDMAMSIDILKSDVLATREAPTNTMPMGGVVVWVSRTADVTYRHTRTVMAKAQRLTRYFGAGPILAPDHAGDRLNIQLRPAMRHGVPPVYVPPEVCNPCQSTNCHSSCSICTSHEQ
jgi:hypothetical protein